MTTGLLTEPAGMAFVGTCVNGPWIGTRRSSHRNYFTLYASDGAPRGVYRMTVIGWNWEPAT